jgi:HK97 family phage major capsid protein
MVRRNRQSSLPAVRPDQLAEELSAFAERTYPGRSARDVLNEYAVAAAAQDPGLAAQMREQLGAQPRAVQRAVAGRARPGNALEGLYRPGAPGAELDGVFAGIGDFVQALRTRDKRLGQVRKVMDSYGSEVPSAGGFLVPEELRSDLVLHSLEPAIVRPRAINVPMGTLRTAVPALDSASNASSILGGFTAYWSEEAAAAVEADPKYERIFLEARKLLAFGSAPNELFEDAPAFDTYLRTVIPPAMAWWEDAALIAGNSPAQPEGYLHAPCAIKVTRATASHVKHADVIGMVTRMWPAGIARAVWACSPDVLTELLNIYELVGTVPTSAAVPPASWLSFDGTRWRLLGLPLYVTEHAAALGSAGDLSLADAGAYLLGTRELLTMDVSPHPKFVFDASEIRIRSRIDGRMWPQSSLIPANSSQTVSAVVVLN